MASIPLPSLLVGLSSPPSAPSSRFPRLGTSWEQTESVGSWAADVSPCTYVFLTLLLWPEPSRAGGRQPFRILPAFGSFGLSWQLPRTQPLFVVSSPRFPSAHSWGFPGSLFADVAFRDATEERPAPGRLAVRKLGWRRGWRGRPKQVEL